MEKRFKVNIVGSSGSGKTTLIQRLKTGEFLHDGRTIGFDWGELDFNTNYGKITFEVFDCSGRGEFEELVRKSWVNADGAIVFADFQSKMSLEEARYLKDNLREDLDGIPIVLAVNKYDIPDIHRELKGKYISTYRDEFDVIYRVSAKSNYNYEKPFLFLARKLMGKDDLVFVETPAIIPPEISFE